MFRKQTLLVVLCLFLAALPAGAQDGLGVVREPNPRGAASLGSINPLLCNNRYCERINDLLFPSLIHVDPVSGYYTPAPTESYALATEWLPLAGREAYVFRLRSDLTWRDGTPVTAYDVMYTYEAAVSERLRSPLRGDYADDIVAVLATSPTELIYVFEEARCSAPFVADMPVVPSHVFAPDFTAQVQDILSVDETFFVDVQPENVTSLVDAWTPVRETLDFSNVRGHAFNNAPTVTAGPYVFAENRPTEYLRLVSADGRRAFEYVDVGSASSGIEAFLESEVNLLDELFLDRLPDVEASGAQVYSSDVGEWAGIILNLADPTEPRSAFDEDGNPQVQGEHPLFANVEVRRALQLAIDVESLIDVSLSGYGTPIAMFGSPSGWAATDLPLPRYDFREAERILEANGWKDVGGDGVRECVGCGTAEEGQPFSFTLSYDDNDFRLSTTATLIATQLRRVGVSANVQSASAFDAREQRFDAFMMTQNVGYPENPADTARWFVTEADERGVGQNYGSYSNRNVDNLYERLETGLSCDVDTQLALYADIQAQIAADQPYIWLYAPHDAIAFAPEIQGVEPQPSQALQNMPSWIVTR